VIVSPTSIPQIQQPQPVDVLSTIDPNRLHTQRGSYKMNELRQIAKALGIKSSGTKAELVSSIISVLNRYYGQNST
jgi:hypothetical protein